MKLYWPELICKYIDTRIKNVFRRLTTLAVLCIVSSSTTNDNTNRHRDMKQKTGPSYCFIVIKALTVHWAH